MFHGMMTIYKEAGYTSSDVVARLRGILHMKKIGHTGTLDPDAEGVLPVCLGIGTKLCELIADRDKEYIAVMRLGIATDTQDMSGTVLEQISDEEVLRLLTPQSSWERSARSLRCILPSKWMEKGCTSTQDRERPWRENPERSRSSSLRSLPSSFRS